MGISDDIRKKPRRHPVYHFAEPSYPASEEPEVDHFTVPEHPHQEITEQEPSGIEQLIESKEQESTATKDHFFADIPEHNPAHTNKNKQLVAQVLIWLIVFVTIFVVALTQNPFKKDKKADTTDTTSRASTNDSTNYYAGESLSQDDATSTTAQSSTNTTTPPTSTTTTPPATTTVPSTTSTTKSAIKLKVLNGNGITGSADKVRDTLTAAGFTVSSVANARRFSYSKTYVYYNTGKLAEANLVKDALTTRECEASEDSLVTGTYDVVVVVGKK